MYTFQTEARACCVHARVLPVKCTILSGGFRWIVFFAVDHLQTQPAGTSEIVVAVCDLQYGSISSMHTEVACNEKFHEADSTCIFVESSCSCCVLFASLQFLTPLRLCEHVV